MSQVSLMRLAIWCTCWEEKLPKVGPESARSYHVRESTESEANAKKSREVKTWRSRQIKFRWHCLSSVQPCLTLFLPLEFLVLESCTLYLTQGSLNLGFLFLAARKVLINTLCFAFLTYLGTVF